MPTKQTSWVSGSAVQEWRQGYHISKIRDGFGSAFRTYGKEWFFFPIPTPTIVGGKPAFIAKVFLLYKTLGTTTIKAIHLDDGRKKVWMKQVNVAGTHDQQLEKDVNFWEFKTPLYQVKFGLNMGAYVDFGPHTQVGVPEIQFVAAGIEFEIP